METLLERIVAGVAFVTVGNEYFAEYAARFNWSGPELAGLPARAAGSPA